ncbi:PPE family protein [Mycobacterium sp. MFM001]|uniref:PPE family protein n=1 Tax=Mycobacterium sp. MFM001 TaxID=2049453 RepID=UPI000DA557A2|nr:PPE family protein [Mycobacterium sp. MFM001]GBE67489.1 PPE family protein [Mycobacterium sp. MFM001]
MDWALLMPEVNSARIYAGPGPFPLLAAAAAWHGLAAELESAAAAYQSVVVGLTGGPWLGPSSIAMAASAATYVTWMHTTAAHAAQTAGQAQLAASAFEAAFAMTVPPPVIAANRALLMALVATNFFGQNTPAIMATEAHYMEMWAQDAAAMYGYAAASAAITAGVTPWTPATPNTNLAALPAQHLAAGGSALGAVANHAQTIAVAPQAMAAGTQALQSLASPAASSSTTGSSLASSLLSNLFSNPANAFFLMYPIVYGLMLPTQMMSAFSQMARMGVAAPAIVGGAAGAARPLQLMLPGMGGAAGLGSGLNPAVSAGMGRALSMGPLSVPQSWAAAAAPEALLGRVPLVGVPMGVPGNGFGGGSGVPMIFGGLPRAATAGSGSTGAATYGPRLAGVVARPPAAGYPRAPESPAAGVAAPVPGYRPTIVYLPTNGNANLPTNGHAPVDALTEV